MLLVKFWANIKINKTKITVIFGILVLSVLAGLFIRIFLKELPSKPEQIFAPVKLLTESSKPPLFSEKLGGLKELEKLNVPVLPIPKPNLKAVSLEKSSSDPTMTFFDNINKAAKAAEKSLMPDNAPIRKASITTSAGIILSLSKDQFHFLYPDSFITGLIDSQNLFIREIDPAYEPLLKIETDPQVRFVEEKIVATLLSANMITKERAEQFITTIRFTLPELQLIDLQKYYSDSIYEASPLSKFLNAASGRKTESPRVAPKGLFLAGFVKQLAEALSNKAQAFCGSCSSLPECFQQGASTPAKAGTETVKFACYCTGCLSSLGCLSSNNGQAAIYDQTTGICGSGL